MSENAKIYQDATQGYIEVEDLYNEELVDTLYMQRERKVSQVGLQSVFTGASHDRFSHSLGVFGMGKKIYSAFKDNVIKKIQHLSNKEQIFNWLDDWQVLFEIACLVHDIGHPGFSHTFEYLYNDDYINLGDGQSIDDKKLFVKILQSDEVKRLFERYLEVKNESECDDKKYLEKKYLINLQQLEGYDKGNELHAQPHEIMSAYHMLCVMDLRLAVEKIRQKKKIKSTKKTKKSLNDDLTFISRMITGCKYDLGKIKKEHKINIKHKYSLRNCIIELLNGKIDADSIDYLNRNAHFAGYASNTLDVSRLCSAFSVRYDETTQLFSPSIKKNALSSLDGFIQGRYFEPKWLYSHHKVVYHNEVLLKYLMKMSNIVLFRKYCEKLEKEITELIVKNLIENDIIKNNETIQNLLKKIENSNDFINKEKGDINTVLFSKENEKKIDTIESIYDKKTIVPNMENLNYKAKDLCLYLFEIMQQNSDNNIGGQIDKYNKVAEFINLLNDFVGRMKYVFTGYILSPVIKTIEDNNVYFKSNDSSIECLFKNINYNLKHSENSQDNIITKKTQFRMRLYQELLQEYETRNYRKSFWKSYEEYRLFLKEAISGLPIDVDTASLIFSSLITEQHNSSNFIEFEDVTAFRKGLKKDVREMNGIYVNYYDDNFTIDKASAFKEVFKCFGSGLIIRFCKCAFKSYDKLNIEFNNEKYVDYKDVKSWACTDPGPIWFPYIYFKKEDVIQELSKSNDDALEAYRQNLYDRFKNVVHEYFNKYLTGDLNMTNEMKFLKGKIIRDSVHGDIFVENKYLDIINTNAFQRLHRIKQLATADMVFPEAVHTRFAHSLGTFWVMKQIVKHFCSIFDELSIEYTEHDIEVILVSALLHDIGHGPLSHAFEHVKADDPISHETWTIKIIEKDAELGEVLKGFGKSFKREVISCLKNDKFDNKLTLRNVLAELISSNIDADRFDYLLRDSYNTGEKFGIIDLQKLIASMVLTEYNGEARVAIQKNALPVVEQYAIGRYNMYAQVYNSPRKLMTESLFGMICKRIVQQADDLGLHNDTKNISDELKSLNLYKVIKKTENLSVNDYLKLDDYTILKDISVAVELLQTKDKVLCEMYNSFLSRKGYERKNILDNSRENYDKFDEVLKNKFNECGIDCAKIVISRRFDAYDYSNEKKEILFINNFGQVNLFSEVSKLFVEQENIEKKLWRSNVNLLYFNKDVALIEYYAKNMKDGTEQIEEIEKLIDSYDIKKHTEIENKYYCSEENIDKIANKVKKDSDICDGYKCMSALSNTTQTDTYYDSDEFILNRYGYSLRCREIGDKKIFTLKKPINMKESKDETQFIRFEFNFETKFNSLNKEVKGFLEQNNLVAEINNASKRSSFNLNNLNEVVRIINNRKQFTVKKNNDDKFECEICLDSVKYVDLKNEENVQQDFQIEMELKSDYTHRIILNEFADCLCKKYDIQTSLPKRKLSKYTKALETLKLIR